MNKHIFAGFLILLSFTACKKNDFNLLSQTYADVPVTVDNRTAFYNGVPYVETSKTGAGTITFVLSIPSGTGRTIKELTRVGTSNSINDYRVVESTSVQGSNYITAPISASGTTVTYTTSLAEYVTKTTGMTSGGTVPTTAGTATSFLGRYFYFMLTLDNGQQLIAVPVRVYVNP